MSNSYTVWMSKKIFVPLLLLSMIFVIWEQRNREDIVFPCKMICAL